MASLVASLLRLFDWDDVGPALTQAFQQLNDASSMEVVLKLANQLNDKVAQNTLTLAVQKATQFSGNELCSFKCAELLWVWALRPDDKGMFDALVNKIIEADASALRPAIETFTKYLEGVDTSGDKFSALVSIVSKRMAWLNENIQSLDKPFAWSMPDAQFPDNAHVQEFL
ncbi:unnamed protein product [Phytophthora lilii]|nr:unnamed protein product [Phytophthora lilii]